ncbi:MAG: hypothetical protein EXS32_10660, partial [Opitutus sp.]|nr:hypothetical protein [Opitutus sp.]
MPASLLVVLTPFEAENFFPAPLLAELRALSPDFRELDPTDLSAADFARDLAAADPEILLACWKTPALPPVLPSRLRYICYLAGSIKTFVTRAHLERGLVLTNWGSSVSRVVAE